MYESPETDIVHHTLKEFLIFAATCGFALKQEIVQADGCSAEGVGLDDICACLEIIRMNLRDNDVEILMPGRQMPEISGRARHSCARHCFGGQGTARATCAAWRCRGGVS